MQFPVLSSQIAEKFADKGGKLVIHQADLLEPGRYLRTLLIE